MTSQIPQNDPVDVALDRAGAVLQGQAGQHGVVVMLEPGGEGVQVGKVVVVHGGDPGAGPLAAPSGHHLGERGDVRCGGVQVRAAGQRLCEFRLLAGVQGIGVAQHPSGDALIVDGRVFIVDCGRGSPSAFAGAGLDFSRLEAVFLTHLHADHTGDLAGLLLYGWGVRVGDSGPLAPIRVYGPSRPEGVPAGDATFHRETTIRPDLPAPGTADLVENILAGYAYHLNVMPLDARMPDVGALVRATDIPVPPRTESITQVPVVVVDDGVQVTAAQ